MTQRLGENIQKEWEAEARAGELWEALQIKDHNREAGLATVANLAAAGSSLAMLYLGCAYIEQSDQQNLTLGEDWLLRSTKSGSIEGQVQLSMLYKRQGRWAEAEYELKSLADQGYPPAMESLGRLFYQGPPAQGRVVDAVHYLKLAKSHRHIFAMGRLAYIYRKERLGLRLYLSSQLDCLKRAPSSIWYILKYPDSDRLRQI